MALGEQELGAARGKEGLAAGGLTSFETEELGGRRRERARGRVTAEGAGIGIDQAAGRMGIVRLVGEQDGAREASRVRGIEVEVRDRGVGEERDEECAHDPNGSPGPRHRQIWLARAIRKGQVGLRSSPALGIAAEAAAADGVSRGAGA